MRCGTAPSGRARRRRRHARGVRPRRRRRRHQRARRRALLPQGTPDARVLILDNHDDFGGHAKRNEFRTTGAPTSATAARSPSTAPRPTAPVAKGADRRARHRRRALREGARQRAVHVARPALRHRSSTRRRSARTGSSSATAARRARSWRQPRSATRVKRDLSGSLTETFDPCPAWPPPRRRRGSRA